ncbi:tape measure protein [Acinetobacter gyllenbergii]|uniref:tape measure protein n=1 Tax=Acinetobacter gyllenbergii TaxID=134534 RepID=UPI003F56A023
MTQESRLVIVIDSRNAARNARNLSDELNSIERNGDFATRSTDRLGVATRQLAGYMAGLVTVGAAVTKMDTYTGLNNRIKLVTSSQYELNQALKDTFDIAQATGQSWDSTAQVYQRFADNAKSLGITLQQTASLTDTVAKAISVSGGSAASAEAALVQFGQALASGVLRGEEFNSISEQAPALLKAIATGLNTNIGALRGMAAEGKLTGEVVIKALTKAKASVDDLFGKTDFTIANSFTQLSNAVTKFVGEAGKGSGAAQAISTSLSGLANNLETATNVAMVGGAYWMGTLIPVMYKSVVASGERVKALLVENQAMNAVIMQAQRKAQAEYNAAQAEMTSARAAVVAAEMEVNANRAVIQSEIQRIQATIAATNAEKAQEAQSLSSQITDKGRAMSVSRMATLQKAQALMTAELTVLEQKLASSAIYTAARNTQTVATERLTVATSGLNVANSLATRSSVGLLGALGGPVGLGLTVAGVAASYLLLKDNTDSATEALDLQKISVRELTEEYQKMSLAKLLTEIDTLKSKLADAKKTQSKALIELQSVAPAFGNQSTDKQRKQAEDLSKIIKDLRNEAITTDSALQQMSKAGFSDDQLTRAGKTLVKYDDVANTISIVNAQLGLAKSSISTASEGYENASEKIADLNNQYTRLNNQLGTSGEAFGTVAKLNLEAGARAGTSAAQFNAASDALEEFTKGKLSASEVARLFNANLPIPKETIDSFIKQAAKIDENKSALDKVNSELKKQNSLRDSYLEQSQGVLAARQEETKELNNQIDAKQRLNALDKLREQKTDSQYILMTSKNLGGDIEKAKALLEYRKQLGLGSTGGQIPQAERKHFEESYAALQSLKAYEDKITESKRNQTKEIEKQEKLTKRLVGISGNSGIGTGAHLDVRYGGSMSGQRVSNEHLARLKAADKPLSSFRVSSDYGPRKAPTKGASSFHKGIDFAMPVGTPITTNVAVKDVQTAYDPKGGGYYSTVTFEDGVVLKLLHQSPNMQGKVKGGASKGSDKAGVDVQSQIERQLDAQRALENEVAGEVQRIKNNLTVRLEDVDKAGFTPERSAEIKAELQRRAENDIAIAQQALRTKLDDYKEFQKTEAELLEESFARKKFIAAHDLEMTNSQRQEAVNLLSQQEQQELALIKLSQEQRLYQSKLFLLSESEAIRERYRLERKEIEETERDERERRKRLALSREQEQLEHISKAAQASKNWGSTYAEMTGNSQMFQLDQSRQDRTGQSLAIADSQNTDVMARAQDPNADMEALAAEQEAIWQAHRDRMALIDQDYWSKTAGYQFGMASDLFGSLMGLAEGYAGKQSGIYKGMAAAQQAFSLFSVASNSFTAISAAWASAPFPANLPAVGAATLETGLLQAALKALTPQGFATGGQILGPGTGTSDSIPIMASNKEYMIRAAAAEKLGLENLNYINRTGELPKMFATGGAVGGDVSESRSVNFRTGFNQKNNDSGDVKINQTITFTDGGASVDTQGQKDIAQSLNSAMNAWARRESMQGGVLYKLVRK